MTNLTIHATGLSAAYRKLLVEDMISCSLWVHRGSVLCACVSEASGFQGSSCATSAKTVRLVQASGGP
jgi:hypothetical protein